MITLDPTEKAQLKADFIKVKKLYKTVVSQIASDANLHSDLYEHIQKIKSKWDAFCSTFESSKRGEILDGSLETYIRNALMSTLIQSQKKGEKLSSSNFAWTSGPFSAFQDTFERLQSRYKNDIKRTDLLGEIVSLVKSFASIIYSPDTKAFLDNNKFQLYKLSSEISSTFRDDRKDKISNTADKSLTAEKAYLIIKEYLKNLETASVTGAFKADNGVKFNMQFTEAPYHFTASLLYEVLNEYSSVDDITDLSSYNDFVSSFDQFYLETHGDDMVKGAFTIWKTTKKESLIKTFHLFFSKLQTTLPADALAGFIDAAKIEVETFLNKKISRIKSSDKTEFENIKSVVAAFDDEITGMSAHEATKGLLGMLSTAIDNINFSDPAEIDELKQIKERLRNKQFILYVEMFMNQIISKHTGR